MLYLSGAGFSFAFLSVISEMGRFLPFPKVHDFDDLVVGISGSIMSEYSTLKSLKRESLEKEYLCELFLQVAADWFHRGVTFSNGMSAYYKTANRFAF
jgi:hypothetical protein